MKKREKILNAVKTAASAAWLAVMTAPITSYAGFLGGDVETISVNTDISAKTMLGKLIGIIAGLFVLVGIVKCATSAFSILEAYSEDNSAGVNKAVKQLGIGVAFIAAPMLLTFLLS